jgi:hypothetical protein
MTNDNDFFNARIKWKLFRGVDLTVRIVTRDQ